ncbi:CPBP family intramembrane metalloprotease [Priestia filamentosa]|uniref:CPBP family intramembrane glutamic endopeptidase n=1 Tax=Priestia filamentosa TaxID=1402861 RepID=UPI003F1611FF
MNATLSRKSTELKEPVNFTYKNFAIIIGIYFVLQFIISFSIGIYLGMYYGINDANEISNFLSGPYGLILDALEFFLILTLYKPARDLVKPLWDLSVLKKINTYIFIILGLIVIIGSQYVMLDLLQLETGSNQVQQLGPDSFNNNFLGQIIFILSVALITPIKEELLYRGLICNFLTRRHHVIMGVLVSSLIFGIFHIGFPLTATIMGIVFAILFYRTKSIMPSLILHIVWNVIASFSLLS